jgi:hypothetical protein
LKPKEENFEQLIDNRPGLEKDFAAITDLKTQLHEIKRLVAVRGGGTIKEWKYNELIFPPRPEEMAFNFNYAQNAPEEDETSDFVVKREERDFPAMAQGRHIGKKIMAQKKNKKRIEVSDTSGDDNEENEYIQIIKKDPKPKQKRSVKEDVRKVNSKSNPKPKQSKPVPKRKVQDPKKELEIEKKKIILG